MDIKFIGSSQSAKAVLYYITNYVSKSQLTMHVVYNALQTAIRKLQAPLPEDRVNSDLSFKDQARVMLRKAANAIVSMQELSAQQVALYAIRGGACYNTVRTPTLCKPDTSDRPLLFSFNLLNLATPLLSYAVRLVLLIFVLLSSLPCYLYDAVLILTSDILYSLIDTFLSILRYISTHVFVVEP
jgi:hypothetical protein